MTSQRVLITFGVSALALGASLASAIPATAGGVGDFLSPAFGTACGNLNNGARADGVTSSGTGTGGGNLVGLPMGSALNQCGGADLPRPSNIWGTKNIIIFNSALVPTDELLA
ncbi:hypothetical protein [Streptomyces sp. NPDC056132]|uniref:hypothetical protein n=1 Tax=Streptomyces sp. NPDC056132 TaxID=3345722 RepID=UPI0035DEF3DC